MIDETSGNTKHKKNSKLMKPVKIALIGFGIAVGLHVGTTDILFERNLEGYVDGSGFMSANYDPAYIDSSNQDTHDPKIQQEITKQLADKGLTNIALTPQQKNSETPWELKVSSDSGYFQKLWALREVTQETTHKVLLVEG